MPRETVKLISSDGFEFIVDYDAACVSNTIKSMLSSQGERTSDTVSFTTSFTSHMLSTQPIHDALPTGTFTETDQGEIKFPEIPGRVLERVCQYFYYKLKYQHAPPST